MQESSVNPLDRQTGQPDAPLRSAVKLTGVFELLVNEHRKASLLLQRAATGATEERRTSWPLARRQLLSHERAETLEVYAALEGHQAARDILAQHAASAGQLESVIGELDNIGYDSEDWYDKLRDVVAAFEEHMREEETEFFPRAQELLGEAGSLELRERLVSAQREVVHTLA
jgi:Hemerythrin HHE cation binding domain